MTHFSERSIEIGLVDSNFDKIIFIITIIGTDKSIQITHHIAPHNHNESNITSGLKFNLLPINLGSITFQISICIQIKIETKAKSKALKPNCIIAKIETIQTAIIDQTVGIKFRTNIENPQKSAKSTLNEISII